MIGENDLENLEGSTAPEALPGKKKGKRAL